jgi:hypothetical protein
VVGTVRITFGILLSNVSAGAQLRRREGGPFYVVGLNYEEGQAHLSLPPQNFLNFVELE